MMTVRKADKDDVEFLSFLLREPSIYNAMVDDVTRGMDFDTAQIIGEALFIIPNWEGKDIGCFIFHPLNGTLYETHAAILPQFRGKVATQGARESIKWIFSNTPCRKLIAHVPDNNRKTYAIVKQFGWEKIGTNTKSLLVNGTLHDQDIYGCEKEKAKWDRR